MYCEECAALEEVSRDIYLALRSYGVKSGRILRYVSVACLKCQYEDEITALGVNDLVVKYSPPSR